MICSYLVVSSWFFILFDFVTLQEINELGMPWFCRSSDLVFYESPRFVTHIDDPAIAALTKYYKEVFPPSNTPGVALLDMCSSWVSHFPAGYKQERIVGMGLNEEELKANKVRITTPFDPFLNILLVIWFSYHCFFNFGEIWCIIVGPHRVRRARPKHEP